jgi:hypothetical protein
MVMGYLKPIQAQLTVVVCFLLVIPRRLKFRHLGITQKKAYNIQNTVKSLKSRIELTVLHTADATICLLDRPM